MHGFIVRALVFYILAIFLACNTAGPGLFEKRNFHEQYGRKLTEAGLKETALGSQWFDAAAHALTQPLDIKLPYEEAGYFAAEQPRAVGLRFSGKRGEKLQFQLQTNALKPFVVYADLWREQPSAPPKFLQSIDTAKQTFELEVEDNEVYILRLQPELLGGGDYTLSIAVGAVLHFPVAGNNGRIGSVWGDARDAGGRRHEGIDIFAPKRTPVIAAADGTVTRVNENNLGGKVVWMQPKAKNYTLYYAHLDEQLATDGQRVKKGDTIGLVGNTGNARSTPPHLHFGIYATGGAVDPLPFVNPLVKKPVNAFFNKEVLSTGLRLKSPTQFATSTFSNHYQAYTIVYPVAATATHYKIILPDNTVFAIAKSAAQPASLALKEVRLHERIYLLDAPFVNAAKKEVVEEANLVSVIGYFNDFVLVRQKEKEGWVERNSVQ